MQLAPQIIVQWSYGCDQVTWHMPQGSVVKGRENGVQIGGKLGHQPQLEYRLAIYTMRDEEHRYEFGWNEVGC